MAQVPEPKKLVPLYDPDEFEEFVKEWVPALEKEPGYVAVERLGGSGDHGIDVAGYLSTQRLEGEWHNYQCKRYAKSLTWATVAHEMRKMFISAAQGHFTVPTRYVFVAPAISRTLRTELAKPTDSREKFLAEFDTTTDAIVTILSVELRAEVRALAAATCFSMFECIDLDKMLAQHRTTPHWAQRFPYAPLPQGPEKMLPPEEHHDDERRYLQRLLEVYQEKFPDLITELKHVADVEEADGHLKRHRVAFYAAESLRVFARDSAGPDYFDKVMKDVYDIVVEVAECPAPDGWTRLAKVVAAAGSVQLTPTILTPYVEPDTRKGVCHHLANQDRLTWCRKGDG
ncbi:ABC-three component system protein [Kitasatospora hibisci]|uniref:ABC-three component system protein n=1 Tax=Kitasatospora hibisci TaxID=3369522 RepID=UPI0037546A0A